MPSLDSKIAANKSNESIENESEELEKGFGLVLSRNTTFDKWDGLQTYLIFQPVQRYFKIITNTKYIAEWNLRECLMKVLNLLLRLIIVLLH